MWHQVRGLQTLLQPVVAPSAPEMPLPELIERAFPQVRYLWLRRRDAVAQAVSFARAKQTGRWHSVDLTGWFGPGQTFQPEAFDFAQIDRLVEQQSRCEKSWKRFFERYEIQPLTLVYEDFAPRLGETLREALDFLGQPVQPGHEFPPPRLEKQADAVSAEWARRYREMKNTGGSEDV